MSRCSALTILTLAQYLAGCGQFDSHDGYCEDGKCDGQSEFARSVVLKSSPLALTNTQQERVTWPLWGSAFTVDGIVRARVAIEPTAGKSGIVIAMPGDPEERRQFEPLMLDREYRPKPAYYSMWSALGG